MTDIAEHRCTEAGCPFVGQRTDRSCQCHKSREQMLMERIETLATALEDALAEHTAKSAECPIDSGRFKGRLIDLSQPCPSCRSRASEACWTKHGADSVFVGAVKAALTKEPSA